MMAIATELKNFAESRISGLAIDDQEIRELRPVQLEIISKCAQALNESKHILIQAPTGCGKTLAYSLVANYIIEKNSGRVLIVCPTKDLQKQISETSHALGLKFIEVYGSGEYTCQIRNKILGTNNAPVVTVLCDYLKKCPFREEGECSYFRLHGLAKEFPLVITNYNKYIESWDILKGENKFDFIILDEAHNLEEITEQSLTAHISLLEIKKRKEDFRVFKEKNYKKIEEVIPALKYSNFYFLDDLKFNEMDIIRVGGRFEELIREFSNLKFSSIRDVELKKEDLNNLVNKCKNLINALERFSIIETFTVLRPEDMSMIKFREKLTKFIMAATELKDYYLFKGRLRGEFPAYPDIVGEPEIREMIQDILGRSAKLQCHVSATLGNLYDYAEKIGILKQGFIECRVTEYPFDIRRRILLGLTNGPSMNKYGKNERYSWEEKKKIANKILEELLLKWPGNTLIFFRSREEAENAYNHLSKNLLLSSRSLFQKYFRTGKERKELIERFKAKKGSILFGFGKMNQGLDLPGETLTLIIVYSSPFVRRTEQMEKDLQLYLRKYKSSRIAFEKVDLDVAARRLSQLIGRLIRTNDDFGAVVVIDRRFYMRFYDWMKGRNMFSDDIEFKFVPLNVACKILERFWQVTVGKEYAEYVDTEIDQGIKTLKDFESSF